MQLMTGSKEDLSPTLFDSATHFPMYLSDKHTAYLLKLQLTFPGNCQTQLRFDSILLFCIVLIYFLDASITFFDIQ